MDISSEMIHSLLPVFLVSVLGAPVGPHRTHGGRAGDFLIVSDLTLAVAKADWQVALGAAIWGIHMGLTQGLLAAMVADTSRQDLRGTALGVFSLASGIAILFGSLIAGLLWDRFGAPATFYAGAIFSGCALIGFLLYRRLLAGCSR